MKVFLLLFTITAITLTSCKGQPQKEQRTIYNKDFKWRITIPAGFDTVSADTWAKMQNRGAKAIEKTYETEVENNAKTIFVFQKGPLNYFESNYQPFDPAKDGDYVTRFREVNNMLYGTFEAQMPGTSLDSSSSTQKISGLTFQTFKVAVVLPNKRVMTMRMFSRLFGKREFTINILTFDKEMEKQLLDAWLQSTFDK